MADQDPATMSAEQASDYFMSLARENEDEASLVFVQQQINDFNTRLEQAGAAGVGLNPADTKLKDELQSLRDRLRKPTFFDEMNTTFREPLTDEVMTHVYQELQDRLQFNNGHGDESITFDTHLKECLVEMLSARQFYTELGFLAFFKRSFFRLFAGVGCTYFEAEFALTIASSIINNTLFTATIGYAPDIGTIIGYLNTAYQSCTQKSIINLLESLGVSPESAPQIYEKIKDFSKEQIKFVLKCLFLKRVVGGITSAERSSAAQQPQRPRPSFFQMISHPRDLLDYLKSIGPSDVAGIAGAPNLSLSSRAITSFRGFMGDSFKGIKDQLNTVFPDTADDEIKMILFKLLLNLNDDSTEDDIGLALSVLVSALYSCIEAKYPKMTSEVFRKLCKKVCPGLLVGLTQETVASVYGPSIQESSQSSTAAVMDQDSPPKHINDADSRQGIVSRAMSALRQLPLRLAERAQTWFGGWFERTRKPDEINTRVSIRGDATHQFLKACDAIKKRMPKDDKYDKYATSIDNVLNAFKHTVHYDEKGDLKASEETDYDKELRTFNDSMAILSKIKDAPQDVVDMLRKFQNAAWEQYSGYCELLSSMSVPFGGNSLAMLTATETVIERMTDTLKSMIVSSDAAVFDIQRSIIEGTASKRRKSDFSGSGFGSGSGPAQGLLGGRSRSRKRSVSKRTRRKGVAKKQNSKKNKRQSRRKVRRASSRKGRK